MVQFRLSYMASISLIVSLASDGCWTGASQPPNSTKIGPTLIFARLKTISNTENTAADVGFLNKTMGNPQGDKIRERSFGHSDLLANVVVLD